MYNVRKKYIEGGLERAILRKKPDRVYERRLDGEGEAHLIALACSKPPDGYERWSLRLLKDRIIRLEIVDKISHETIRQTQKKQSQAVVKRAVVCSTTSQRGLCLPNGRHPRGVHPASRPQTPLGLYG